MVNNGEKVKNKISCSYLPHDHLRMMNFGMAKNFFHLFSPSAKWCCPSAKGWCPSGKSIEFFFSHSNFVLRSRKKLNGLSFRTTSFCFRIKQMEKVFCHPSVSPSLDNLLANKNLSFYFPASLHYFPPLQLYFSANPYSKYHCWFI